MKNIFKKNQPKNVEFVEVIDEIEEYTFDKQVPEWRTFKTYLYTHKNISKETQVKAAARIMLSAFADGRIDFNTYIDRLSNFAIKIYNLNMFENKQNN